MQRKTPEWLYDAVIYQIYPQSFYDANGDGIGDLPGILAKLDYVRSLGVSAIWINPFFVSPFNDAGYDVADYYQVAPRYGTNADFARLCEAAHERGLKVLFDLVVGHCSWDNAWFRDSCRETPNAHSDWFIWTDSVWAPAPPGMEVIRGYAPRMGGYMTNFFVSQPAFNFGFAHPDPRHAWQQAPDAPGPLAVRAEVKRIIAHWLELGADGFRADMALSLVKGDLDGRATAAVWREIRDWLDEAYPGAVMVAEGGRPAVSVGLGGFHIDFCLPWSMPAYESLFRRGPAYGGGGAARADRYAFSVFGRQGHGNIREFLDEYLRHYEQVKEVGFIAIPEGNHDLHPRISYGRTPDEVLQVLLFTMTMPGVPFLYYGDEINMRTVEGLPGKEGSYERTGVRTPMQWDGSANAGFSTVDADAPYLPIDPDPGRPTVAAQEAAAGSFLNRVRELIALHRSHVALRADAAFELLHAEAGEMPLVYRREKDGAALIVAINPTGRTVAVVLDLPGLATAPRCLWGYDAAFRMTEAGWCIELPPASGGMYEIAQ